MQLIRHIGRDEPAPPWGLLTAVLTVVVMFLTVIVGTSITTIILGETPTAVVAGYCIALLATTILVGATRNRRPQDQAAMAFRPTRTPLILVFMLGVGVAILYDTLGLILTGASLPVAPLLSFFDLSQAGAPAVSVGIAAWLFALLLLVVFQPVAEEMVLRGVAYPALRASLGKWMGFFMSAVLHAIFHLIAYAPPGGNSFVLIWYTLILPFLDGLFLGAVRAQSRSTRASMVAHAGLGAFAFIRALILAG